jgi:hypothetical protein
MAIGVKIDLDRAAIARLVKAVAPAAEKTIDALKTDVVAAQVMPYDLGDMQNNQTFTATDDNGDSIDAHLVTGAPQARRLYFHPEYNFQKGNNPNAGGEWLKPWISGDRKDFVKDTFAENYKKETGV